MSSVMPPPCSSPLPVAAPVILSTANTPTMSVPNTPLIDMLRSGLPSHIQLKSVAESSPMNAAVLVVMKMCAIALGSAAIVDPGLTPNQPSHSTRHPMNADVKLCGGIGFTLPSALNLPRRGPRMSTPASAAQPPMLCTTVEPAKSLKPALASQPPPQAQCPPTG